MCRGGGSDHDHQSEGTRPGGRGGGGRGGHGGSPAGVQVFSAATGSHGRPGQAFNGTQLKLLRVAGGASAWASLSGHRDPAAVTVGHRTAGPPTAGLPGCAATTSAIHDYHQCSPRLSHTLRFAHVTVQQPKSRRGTIPGESAVTVTGAALVVTQSRDSLAAGLGPSGGQSRSANVPFHLRKRDDQMRLTVNRRGLQF